jgi:hypothetical protein
MELVITTVRGTLPKYHCLFSVCLTTMSVAQTIPSVMVPFCLRALYSQIFLRDDKFTNSSICAAVFCLLCQDERAPTCSRLSSASDRHCYCCTY